MKFFSSFLAVLLTCGSVQATDTLPYSTRTHPYNGFWTTPSGDIRTVGMAGATIGLADTFIATQDNPAGLAMTLDGADFNLTSNQFYDGYAQNYNESLGAFNIGLAVNQYPWGWSFGYSSNPTEGQTYMVPGFPVDPANVLLANRELKFAIARVFFENRLSIGAKAAIAQASSYMTFITQPQLNVANTTYGLSGSIGASFQVVPHVLIGLSYHPSQSFIIDPNANPSSTLHNFVQSIYIPSRFGFGVGWIPNRFFRADLTTLVFGSTPNTALLKDDVTLIGQTTTVQPRLGMAYQIFDYRQLRGTLFGGFYYDPSRIQGTSNRLHATAGVEIKPWIFSFGAGIDAANQYRNYIVSVGIDIIKTFEESDIIPPLWHPPYRGVFPKPTRYSDEGLARPLVKDWAAQHRTNMDPIEIGKQIPKKIEEKAKEFGEAVGKGFQVEDPKKKKRKKHRH